MYSITTTDRNYQMLAELFSEAPFTVSEFEIHIPEWERNFRKSTTDEMIKTGAYMMHGMLLIGQPWVYLPRSIYNRSVEWAEMQGLSEEDFIKYCYMWDCLEESSQDYLREIFD